MQISRHYSAPFQRHRRHNRFSPITCIGTLHIRLEARYNFAGQNIRHTQIHFCDKRAAQPHFADGIRLEAMNSFLGNK
ncbi:MAG: hypothetical protein FWC89_11620 [Defluviitaleaceae bacterium]|nr:hypothetical protein [Defluviitaleaceae bacterium]